MVPTLPSEAEAMLAKETCRVLSACVPDAQTVQFRLLDDSQGEQTLTLPAAAVQLLVRVLEEMAQGNAVTLIPIHAELTTQEAADILNVSRPYLIQLLDEDKIEHRRVGTHRRVKFESLMKYRREAQEARRKALNELVAYDQELGI